MGGVMGTCCSTGDRKATTPTSNNEERRSLVANAAPVEGRQTSPSGGSSRNLPNEDFLTQPKEQRKQLVENKSAAAKIEADLQKQAEERKKREEEAEKKKQAELQQRQKLENEEAEKK